MEIKGVCPEWRKARTTSGGSSIMVWSTKNLCARGVPHGLPRRAFAGEAAALATLLHHPAPVSQRLWRCS
jgi:hypothetical protein